MMGVSKKRLWGELLKHLLLWIIVALTFYPFAFMFITSLKPILSTVAIFNILSQWNDLIWPLVTITSEHLKTIPVGIAYLRTSIWRPETGQVMATYIITSLPLVLLFFTSMRTFIEGLTSGAIKA